MAAATAPPSADGLRSLLEQTFDYAGMFPPASLTFQDALRTSHALPNLVRPWLVSTDMVVRREHLEQLTPETLDAAGWERPCTVCVVGVPLEEATAAAKQASAILRATKGRIRVVSWELRLDRPRPRLAEELVGARRHLDGRIYVEYATSEDLWEQMVWPPVPQGVGLKVRLAGPDALSHGEQATVIAGVADHGVAFKATQGLHHPFPEPEGRGHHHGFLTFTAALRLRQAFGRDFGREDILGCLRERDPAALDLTAGLRYAGRHIEPRRLETLRRALPFAIGSCSLQEPDEDLQALYGPWPASQKPSTRARPVVP
jgi:hypothetical protein